MNQAALNTAVATLLNNGKSFQRTSGLARRFQVQAHMIVDAFDAYEAAFPNTKTMRVYGKAAGGMARA